MTHRAMPAARNGASPAGTTYTLHGHGEPVVLIHGVGMRREAWSPQIESLASTHTVLAYDMLGHGGSALPPEPARLSDYAGQLAELLDHLSLDQVNVAGHSMGALVALEFALSHPSRTLRLAALNAVYRRTPEQASAVRDRAAQLAAGATRDSVGAAIERWFGKPVPTPLAATARMVERFLGEAHPLGYARTYTLFAHADRAHEGRLGGLRMPVLYATGELDPNSSPAMSRAMAAATPNALCEVLSDARHMMNLTDAQRVDDLLVRWLRLPTTSVQ